MALGAWTRAWRDGSSGIAAQIVGIGAARAARGRGRCRVASELSSGGRALVLGGGGVTGVAWEIGLLLGLAEAGIELAMADLFVGTSAGSVVAAQLTSGQTLDQLYSAQVAAGSGEIAARMSPAALVRFVLAMAWPGDAQRARARLGRAALRARTVPEAQRRAVIASRLPSHEWPRQRLLITAVNAETGAAVVFDRDSGVSLVDAVAASCAVPLVWPPIIHRAGVVEHEREVERHALLRDGGAGAGLHQHVGHLGAAGNTHALAAHLTNQ